MFIRSHIVLLILFSGSFLCIQPLNAQLGFDLAIKKPEPYENRELKAERSAKKKFSKYRHFWQNTYTHYNYFFNANNKLNEVIDRAKESHVDDYALLLPFYNYSLETTAQDKTQLDSIIYKSKTAIVMHDLRNDWIDDMYLLWGASYYLKKEFDSAYQMFQFINYAFAEKEKDGYYRYIGSRMDGNSALSIATKEEDGFVKRMMSDPPSRNTAFIWQIRTLIEANSMTEAGSLIAALKKDPFFPERLNSSLEEVQAYWFYKQNLWDSAAVHLANALDITANKQERARWEYLVAQLYDKANKPELSHDYFSKVINHTIDPVLDIYARLNLIRSNKAGGDNYINENIEALLDMAKREKFADYRDIIYYMAAKMELERNNPLAAQQYLLKAAKYHNNNSTSKNRSYLQLADIAYGQKNYTAAASYYDSLDMAAILPADADRITQRKAGLLKVVSNLNRINRQDSLQRLAAMPEAEREAYIKKLVRQLRRQQGLKEEESFSAGGSSSGADVYTTQTKGEWYFYNPVLKKQGFAAFKKVWGNRPNVDNWRRASDVTTQGRTNVAAPDTKEDPATTATDASATISSYDALLANIPLTPDQLKVSNEVIKTSLFALGNAYVNDIEDYPLAIETFETLKTRFPDYVRMDEVLFNLYYSYNKTGDVAKANENKNGLLKNYPASRHTSIINTGVDPTANNPTSAVTAAYENIYDQFIEGNFEGALMAKRNADSMYKTNYWSPQLLYIEAVYHVRQREDSIAKNTLNLIIQQDPNAPLAAKAANMIQVLARRKQIEEELRNSTVVRPKEDTIVVQDYVPTPASIKRDTTVIQKNTVAVNAPGIRARTDTGMGKTVIPPPVISTYMYDANATHYVVVVLNKIDNVYGNETKNAFNRYNKERYYNLPLTNEIVPLDAENKLLLIGKFSNILQATEYVQKVIPLAPKEIIPWLKADKYSFTIITGNNLEVLKSKPDIGTYRKFLEQNSGLKF